jgi:hypothetical protein
LKRRIRYKISSWKNAPSIIKEMKNVQKLHATPPEIDVKEKYRIANTQSNKTTLAHLIITSVAS